MNPTPDSSGEALTEFLRNAETQLLEIVGSVRERLQSSEFDFDEELFHELDHLQDQCRFPAIYQYVRIACRSGLKTCLPSHVQIRQAVGPQIFITNSSETL